jgi:hypothetical protein
MLIEFDRVVLQKHLERYYIPENPETAKLLISTNDMAITPCPAYPEHFTDVIVQNGIHYTVVGCYEVLKKKIEDAAIDRLTEQVKRIADYAEAQLVINCPGTTTLTQTNAVERALCPKPKGESDEQ